MSAEEKQDELKSFEAALAAIMPRIDRLDRERLMFLAGQQSVLGSRVTSRTTTFFWPRAFAFMSAIAATLFIMLVFRPGPGTSGSVAKHAASDAPIADNMNDSTDADKSTDQSHGNRSIYSLAGLSGINRP